MPRQGIEFRDSDHNAGNQMIAIRPNQLQFHVRPEVVTVGGRPLMSQGRFVHKDATGQRFVILDEDGN